MWYVTGGRREMKVAMAYGISICWTIYFEKFIFFVFLSDKMSVGETLRKIHGKCPL